MSAICLGLAFLAGAVVGVKVFDKLSVGWSLSDRAVALIGVSAMVVGAAIGLSCF